MGSTSITEKEKAIYRRHARPASKTLCRFTICAVMSVVPPAISVATAAESYDQYSQGYVFSPDDEGADYLHIDKQIDNGELRDAEAQLQTIIGNLQNTGDRYDGAMVQPLSLLGRVFHESGDYPRAAETLALATQISRIANGLHSAQQLQLVHQEIASLKAMGNIVEANRRHEYAFSIARRHFGRFGEQLVPELLKIGVWYTSTGDIVGARDRFSEARLLLSSRAETIAGDDMLFALQGIARSYRDEAFPPFFSRPDKETRELYERNGVTDRRIGAREQFSARSSINSFHRGSEALIEVVRIQAQRLSNIQDAMLSSAGNSTANGAQNTPLFTADKKSQTTTISLERLDKVIKSPDVDKRPFIDALLELADWYLLTNKSPRAFAYYQHAYLIADADPNTDLSDFTKPQLLYFPQPRDPKIPEAAPKESFAKGFVEIMYDVDHKGMIRRLRTVSSTPKGMMDFRVRASARVARFRPKIVDGLPQPAAAQTYRHDFNYFPQGRSTVPAKVINTDGAATNSPPTPGR